MKTKDLRIGNFVKIDNILCEIIEIYEEAVYCYDKYGEDSHNINVVEPIELTEEVLLKIGFKKKFQSNITKGLFELNYDISDNEFINVICRLFEDGKINLTIIERYGSMMGDNSLYKNGIKYLHQLQNAYYLLTNEELEVDL